MAYGYNPYIPGAQGQMQYGGYQLGGMQGGYAPMPQRMEYQQPQMMQPQQQPGMLSARYVTGRDEAVAAQILPDGNVWLFADIPHGKIYAKQMLPSGMADFREYAASDVPPSQQPPPQQNQKYVTADEFAKVCSELNTLKQIVAQYQLKGGAADE